MTGPQKYRSKGRIFADILQAVQESGAAKVTHILYKANLSHDRLTKYLAQLEDSGLMVRVPGRGPGVLLDHRKGHQVHGRVSKDGRVRRCIWSRYIIYYPE